MKAIPALFPVTDWIQTFVTFLIQTKITLESTILGDFFQLKG